MSAGGFSNVKYEADNGVLHPLRIQPETAALDIGGVTNSVPAEPAGTVKSGISARVSGSRRGLGLFTRLVRGQFGDTAGAAPDGYQEGGVIALPVMTKAFYDAITKGDTGTYLGKVVTVAGKVSEVVR